jgi:hypothetical protein
MNDKDTKAQRKTAAIALIGLALCLSVFVVHRPAAAAMQSMSMPGVENSVGYLASGTSIQPKTASESAPMLHASLGSWTLMFHANATLTAVQQSGLRGRDKLFSGNWLMPMLSRQFGRQSVSFRTMVSLEPLTITRRQYPLLFQSGETAYGLSIIDGQHPHDLVMELAGRYEFRLGERSQLFAYGGPIGEVALGPTAFPHRPSASENPLAPLGHHQHDSTHIANNVITLGWAAGPVQIEASTFHGREPNENRWNFDTGKPDSFATRLTIAPHKNFSGQISTGRLNNPEAGDLEVDVVRTTASLHHNVQFSSGHVSSSLIWGRNKDLGNGGRRIFNSYGLEITSKFARRNWVWTRIENVDRNRTLLPVPPAPQEQPCLLCGVVGFPISLADPPEKPEQFNHVVLGPDGRQVTVDEDPIGRVQAYSLGYERELPVGPSWLNVGLGVQATLYGMPAHLKTVYGNRPTTVAIFLRIRPNGNMADHMKLMHQH